MAFFLCKKIKIFSIFFQKPLDKCTHCVYNIYVRRGRKPLRKEVRKMEGMTENQTKRLIEWLKAQGMTDAQIVECLEYINTKH